MEGRVALSDNEVSVHPASAALERDIERVLITEQEIQGALRRIGDEITLDYDGRDLLLIGVLKGAFMVMADLSRYIRPPLESDFMAVAFSRSPAQTFESDTFLWAGLASDPEFRNFDSWAPPLITRDMIVQAVHSWPFEVEGSDRPRRRPSAVARWRDNGQLVWPLRLAFFIHGSGAETPDLEIDVSLRQDGVIEAIAYDYGTFRIGAELTAIEELPTPDC